MIHYRTALHRTLFWATWNQTISSDPIHWRPILVPASTHVYFLQMVSSLQSRTVICCWSSPPKSFLVSSHVRTHDHISVRSKTIYFFLTGASSSTGGGSYYYCRLSSLQVFWLHFFICIPMFPMCCISRLFSLICSTQKQLGKSSNKAPHTIFVSLCCPLTPKSKYYPHHSVSKYS
jgi:hypothetical protein